MKITVHRPNQIGGCITEIISGNGTRIIIDVGSNLPGNTIGEQVPVEALTKDCDGVFITHYHGDHIGDYKRIHSGTKVYMGDVSKKIFVIWQKRLSLKSDFTDVKPEDVARIEKFETYSPEKQIQIGDLTITPIRTDHSAFDSYMLLIEDGEKSVLHTGDFRTHGWEGEDFMKSIGKVAEKVDCLICEGTMLSREAKDVYSERNLYEDAKKLLSENKHVFVLCSSVNIDTIASFYKAAAEVKPKRLMVADGFQRSVLDAVTDNSKGDPLYDFRKVKIYLPDKPQCEEKRKKCLQMMRGMGFCMLIRAKPFFEDPLRLFPDSTIVYSMWDGYLDEGKPYSDKEKIDFLNKAKANEKTKVICLHTSGHAYEEAIIALCSKLNRDLPEGASAMKIIPIHSEKRGRFEELQKAGKIKGEVIRLESGQSVII